MKSCDHLYLDGAWVKPSGTETLAVLDATTEETIGSVPAGQPADADRAVRGARSAFEGWSQTTVAERAEVLDRLAAGLAARNEEIAQTISAEVGMPIRLSRAIQAGLPAQTCQLTAQLAREYPWEETIGTSRIFREPVGVVAAITPWNYPLHQVICKLAPALVAGCTFILKPSEVAPLTAFLLAEVIDSLGLPPGVFQLVTGTGPVVGEALVVHPEVDMVSFTGSTRAGRRISELAAASVKRVSLELGGKSANVLLDDADFPRAITTGLNECFLNSGQSCNALSRVLVPRSRYEEAVGLARTAAEKFRLGDPRDESAKLGPLVSATQRQRVRDYIRRGLEEGARLVTGGAEAPEGLDRGYFVRPTVFADVTNDMTIAQEEIFGPVVALIPYDGEEEAIRLANDTIYGLAGAVWSADEARALRVARRLRAGQVEVNGGRFNPLAPFGGYKQSGHGREQGRFGLDEYVEIKAVQL